MLTTPGIILDLVEYGTLSDANGQDIMFNLRPITVILKKCGGGAKTDICKNLECTWKKSLFCITLPDRKNLTLNDDEDDDDYHAESF